MAGRKIIHVDMDAFYAAVEQRDFPSYRGKPLIVGGRPDSRGVVATCSYEARAFGIHSAMASSKAFRLCPEAIFVPPRFDVYSQVSRQIREIFLSFTQQVEPLSLDEAYLDVSQCQAFQGSATLIAKEIKKRIQNQTGLTASTGVSYNKFLAKIASDINKPDGFCLITPEASAEFIENLSIGYFHGIGKVTEEKMLKLGIRNGKDLKALTPEWLHRHFGNAWQYYYKLARGIDERPVEPNRIRKSLGAETTFQTDLNDKSKMRQHLSELATEVFESLVERKTLPRCLTIKVKYDDFEQVTRSKTFNNPFRTKEHIKFVIADLLDHTEAGLRKVRLLGVSFSSLEKESPFRQLDLFD